MSSFYFKESEIATSNLSKKIYNEIFSHVFYIIGIILELTDKLIKTNHFDNNFTLEGLKKNINDNPININILLQFINDKYNQVIVCNHSCVSTCYTLKQIELYLNALKSSGYVNLDYNNTKVIFKILMDFTQRETIKRGVLWYHSHSDDDYRYWPNYINVSNDTFKIIYEKNNIIGAEFIVNPNNNINNKEMYIKAMKNNIDYLKFIHEIGSNKVYISWHLADIIEEYGDIVCDGVFNNYGGIFCERILEEEARLNNDKIVIKEVTKIICYSEKFVRIIKDNFNKITDNKYSKNTPWGDVTVNIDKMIDTCEQSKYFEGELNN